MRERKFSTVDVTHVIMFSPRISLRVQRSYTGILDACEYTQEERALVVYHMVDSDLILTRS